MIKGEDAAALSLTSLMVNRGWFVKFGFATTERDNENDIVSYLRLSANIAIDVYQVAPRSVSSPCDAGVEQPETLAER